MKKEFFVRILQVFVLCSATKWNVSAQQILPSIAHEQYKAPIAHPDSLPKFINALPVVQKLGIRWDAVANPSFSARIAECQQDLLGTGHQTTVFGYGIGNLPVTHPGATIVAETDKPITVTWINQLGFRELIPHDTSIMHAYSFPPYIGMTIAKDGVPMVPHLHGGHTDADFDGTPNQWWTPLYHTTQQPLTKGPDFKTNVFIYENSQESGTLWYHDHALGVTRLHAYEGAAGFYFIRDENEKALIASHSIPSGDYEIELAIQDKMFYPDGRLAYPDVPAKAGLRADQTIWPEMYGDVILVNGKAWPYLNVERRQYRFRFLNASDSRFYHIWLDTGGVAIPFKEIGSDVGLLPSPVTMDSLLIGCGERYDLVIDFSNPAFAGKTITLRNDARSPYPDGDPVNPITSGQVMQFRVGTASVADPVVLPSSLRTPIERLIPNKTRELILAETDDEYGRIMPILGTVSKGILAFFDPISENIKLNDVEEWDIYNTTVDAHPVHLHLVSFQVINSQDYTATEDPITHALTNISLVGPPEPPAPGEAGWKDTQVMQPGHVTRIRAKFDKPGLYVWHCHILSHEEHDMMRSFYVRHTLVAPVLGAPVNNRTGVSRKPTFRWKPVVDGETYTLQVSTNPSFSFSYLVLNQSGIEDTSFTPADSLVKNTTYYWHVRATNIDGTGPWSTTWSFMIGTTGIALAETVPSEFALMQNFPDPFNPSTTIQYALPSRSTLRLVIYNVLGQVVKELIHTEQPAGLQSVVWKADVASGLYFYRIEAAAVEDPDKRFVDTKKMLLLR